MEANIINLGLQKFNKTGGAFEGAVSGKKIISTSSIDCSLGNHFTITVSDATTISFSNVPQGSYTCILEIVDGGSNTITWPGSVGFSTALAPIMTASGKDIVVLNTIDAGTTFSGVQSIKDVR